MTSKIGSAVTDKVLQRFTGSSGVNAGLGALTRADREFAGVVDNSQVRAQNVAAEMAERALDEVPGGERLLRKDRERTAREVPNIFRAGADGD
jgi:hypothetical protein